MHTDLFVKNKGHANNLGIDIEGRDADALHQAGAGLNGAHISNFNTIEWVVEIKTLNKKGLTHYFIGCNELQKITVSYSIDHHDIGFWSNAGHAQRLLATSLLEKIETQSLSIWICNFS